MTPKRNWFKLFLLVLSGEGIFLLPFVLARIFRPTLLAELNITNLELGQSFSIYGLVAMLSYFLGGPLADRFSAGKLMALGLWATAIGGLVLWAYPSVNTLYLVYGYWGLTTILLFWSPLLKSTRLWGGDSFQGRAFGGLESGRGLTSAMLGLLAVLLVANQEQQSNQNYLSVVLFTSLFIFVLGVVVWIAFPSEEEETSSSSTVGFKQIQQMAKRIEIWYMAVIIVCAYAGYKVTDDFSLYAHEVLGLNEIDSAKVGSGALWLRPVFALLAGLLADRFGGNKILQWGFPVVILGGLMIATGWASHWFGLSLFLLGFSLIGIYGIRGIYFALFEEANIPKQSTGVAVGIMSVLGYTPDVFMSPLMGYLLDTYEGEKGHQLVFGVLVSFACIGWLCAFALGKRLSRKIN